MVLLLKKKLARIRWLFQFFFCCEIPLRYCKKIKFPHPIGIVIASGAEIGNGVTIYQNVTVGRQKINTELEYPIIEENVIVYAGATIAGNIVIGANSIIGTNAVITKSVPANTTVVGCNRIVK